VRVRAMISFSALAERKESAHLGGIEKTQKPSKFVQLGCCRDQEGKICTSRVRTVEFVLFVLRRGPQTV
jgi:hypothetical protein